MTSNFLSRTRPAEVLIEDEKVKLIRRRETFEDLISLVPESIVCIEENSI